jgi:hypothetical protein
MNRLWQWYSAIEPEGLRFTVAFLLIALPVAFGVFLAYVTGWTFVFIVLGCSVAKLLTLSWPFEVWTTWPDHL